MSDDDDSGPGLGCIIYSIIACGLCAVCFVICAGGVGVGAAFFRWLVR